MSVDGERLVSMANHLKDLVTECSCKVLAMLACSGDCKDEDAKEHEK